MGSVAAQSLKENLSPLSTQYLLPWCFAFISKPQWRLLFILRHFCVFLLKSEALHLCSMYMGFTLPGIIQNYQQQRNVTQYIMQLHGFLQSGTLEQTIKSHYLEQIKAYERLLPEKRLQPIPGSWYFISQRTKWREKLASLSQLII